MHVDGVETSRTISEELTSNLHRHLVASRMLVTDRVFLHTPMITAQTRVPYEQCQHETPIMIGGYEPIDYVRATGDL